MIAGTVSLVAPFLYKFMDEILASEQKRFLLLLTNSSDTIYGTTILFD